MVRRRSFGGRHFESGQSLIEFALILPFLMLLIINVVNFGAYFFVWIAITSGARTGADYMILGASTVGGPSAPTPAKVSALLTNDLNTLKHFTTVRARWCKRSDPVGVSPKIDEQALIGALTEIQSLTGYQECAAALPADPQAPHYVSAMVEIWYTYTPIIGHDGLRLLGIPLSMPGATIRRKAIMRMEG